MSDEREGLPSVSSAERIMECLGSFQMEKHLKDTGPKYAAERGTRIHDALAGFIPMSTLRHSEHVCAERMAFEEARLVENFSMEGAEQIREKRLWMDINGVKAFSGKPDVIYWDAMNLNVLIINYKTGFYLPTPIAENWQMRGEAALVAHSRHYLLSEVTIALIHPNAEFPDRSISQTHTLTREECREYGHILASAARGTLEENVHRTPTKTACKWCLGAKHMVCPEYIASLRP